MMEYCHPLDRVCGLKYCLTEKHLDYQFKPSPENFIVEEEVDRGLLQLRSERARYLVLLVNKKGVDTLYVARELAEKFNVSVESIKFLGFKDRDSHSSQFFFIESSAIGINLRVGEVIAESNKYRVEVAGYTDSKPTQELLLGNKFKVLIDDVSSLNEVRQLLSELTSRGLPAYYGYQRFGTIRYNTHLLGKYLVKGDLSSFINELAFSIYPRESLDSISSRVRREFSLKSRLVYEAKLMRLIKKRDLSRVIKLLERRVKRLFIEAYLAFLYNNALNKYISVHGWVNDGEICVMGALCTSGVEYYGDIMAAESLNIHELTKALGSLGVRGWLRRVQMKLLEPKAYVEDGKLVVEFRLTKGMYASVVLRELFKHNYIP